ncbi:hypothetical protein O181_020977 [Austropuccinia psidii MF-1]|uniref:Uncharacterized protein n=1 Tax=Austropuccinia psidii MF-1 TaxID=1389203 RepID=A0A9Q3CEL1_9BASI|nr:hypothetical protein [Austropuccinia psidii MF-1]
MTYSEKGALKQLQEASILPKLSFLGEYDPMEPIDYIDGLFIDLPSISDYWMNARLNTAFKGHASIWYTEIKKIHARRNWPWWKSQIIQKYSNVPWYGKRPCHLKMTSNKPKERVAEVTNKKNYCQNFGSKDHYPKNFAKAKKKVYAIEHVPEEESSTEDCESDSMGDSIREHYYDYQDPKEEYLVVYQEERQLKIQDTQLEARIPKDTANKNFCKHTQDAQTFLVKQTSLIAYIHGTATTMTVFIYNVQHPLIIDSGAHCSIAAREYLDNYFSNWEDKLFPTKQKSFESASGKMI